MVRIPIMVRGAGSEPPTGMDHPKDINDHTPTASRVEHGGCAARAQQRQRTSTAALVRFRVYILITTPFVSGGRREAPPAAGSLLMEPVWHPAASPPFVTHNARTDEKRGQQNGELWSTGISGGACMAGRACVFACTRSIVLSSGSRRVRADPAAPSRSFHGPKPAQAC